MEKQQKVGSFMFRPFTEREMEKYPDRHFELNEKIRKQINYTLRNHVSSGLLDEAIDDYREHHGEEISKIYRSTYEAVEDFLLNADPHRIFDFIEFCLIQLISGRLSEKAYEVATRLNKWFKLSGYGYEIRDMKFERVDSEFLKEAAIKPALRLLQKEEFEGALREFEEAIGFQKNEMWEDAIKKANDSFESVMKEILSKRGISFDPGDTASDLIQKLKDDGILDPPLLSFTNSLRSTLESGLPTLRNVTPGAGHGRGEYIGEVKQSYCNFAIHLAGSLIVFLIERYEEETH